MNKLRLLGAVGACVISMAFSTASAGEAYAIGPSSTVAFEGTASIINTANAQAQSFVTLPHLQPGFTNFEIVNDEIWGVDGSTTMQRWALDGTYLGGSGLWGYAVDLELMGNQVYAIGPSSTVAFEGTASIINTANAQAQSFVTLPHLQAGFTNFEIVNDEIWGVDGSTTMQRWALDGTYLGGSGLWGYAVDLELMGNQVYAIGPSSTVAFEGTASVINIVNAQAQSFVTLSNFQPGFSNFEIIDDKIWGVVGNTGLWRWNLDGTYFSTSGLYDPAVDLEVVPFNEPPTAEAGANQSIHAGELVGLDGGGSSDDQTPTEILLYSWSFNIRPDGSIATLVGAETMSPSFTADLPGNYIVSLAVTDEGGLSSDPDTVTVSSFNVPPTADAGFDQGAVVGNLVTLDGSASSDADFDVISFAWTLTGAPVGSTASLGNPYTASPFLVPDLPGSYVSQLAVNDGFVDSTPDEMTVTVVTAESFAETSAMQAINDVAELPPSSLTTKGNQTALGQHLSQVIGGLQKGDHEKAIMKLTEAIDRTDGCALRGVPDAGGGGGGSPSAKDYITDCASQGEIYAPLVAARDALSP